MTQHLPRVFIGTLHNGEGDYEKCRLAIEAQRYVVTTHCVISNLNEKDAHNALWSAWREHQLSHDLFVKIDADTILASETVLSEIYQTLSTGSTVTGLQAPLHDYMTDSTILGLNAYTTKVRFLETTDKLYCDRGMDDGNVDVVRDERLPSSLKPAGFHCHHATEIQAFRYGVHRAMKTQNKEIQQLITAWRRHGDKVRGTAVIGSLLAPKLAKKSCSDYTDSGFVATFEEVKVRYDEYVAAINARNFGIFD